MATVAAWIFLAFLTNICAMISLMISVILCYQLCCSKDKIHYLKSNIKFYSISSAMSFSSAAITRTIAHFYHAKNTLNPIQPNSFRSRNAVTFLALSYFFWAFGVLFLYFLFITRLKTAFNGSVYQISNCTMITFYGTSIILLILALIDIIWMVGIVYLRNSCPIFIHMAEYANLNLVLAECFHLIISSVLLYTFVSKLLEVIHNTSIEILDNRHYGSTAVQFCTSHQNILSVITKQTILSIIVIVSSQISLLMRIFLKFNYTNPDRAKETVVLTVSTFSTDCVLNCLCILLTFAFQQRCYLKICGKCDSCLQSVCTGHVQSRLENKITKLRKETLLLQNREIIDEKIELSKSKV